MTKTKRAFLKALSSVTGNLSAAWFGLAIVTPNFTGFSKSEVFIVLTRDIIIGVLLLLATAFIERIINVSK